MNHTSNLPGTEIVQLQLVHRYSQHFFLVTWTILDSFLNSQHLGIHTGFWLHHLAAFTDVASWNPVKALKALRFPKELIISTPAPMLILLGRFENKTPMSVPLGLPESPFSNNPKRLKLSSNPISQRRTLLSTYVILYMHNGQSYSILC